MRYSPGQSRRWAGPRNALAVNPRLTQLRYRFVTLPRRAWPTLPPTDTKPSRAGQKEQHEEEPPYQDPGEMARPDRVRRCAGDRSHVDLGRRVRRRQLEQRDLGEGRRRA